MLTSAFFLVIMLVGVPIGLCLCLSGIFYIYSNDNAVLLQSYATQMFAGVDSYGLIAIPLFILIGEVMNSGGITKRLVDLSMAFVGSVKGGLAYVNILANMLVSSIIGSATAQVAIMSQVMVPEMEKQGYDKTFAAGLDRLRRHARAHHPAVRDVRGLQRAGPGGRGRHADRRHPARHPADPAVLHRDRFAWAGSTSTRAARSARCANAPARCWSRAPRC